MELPQVHSPLVSNESELWVMCSAPGCDWQVELYPRQEFGDQSPATLQAIFNVHLIERFHPEAAPTPCEHDRLKVVTEGAWFYDVCMDCDWFSRAWDTPPESMRG